MNDDIQLKVSTNFEVEESMRCKKVKDVECFFECTMDREYIFGEKVTFYNLHAFLNQQNSHGFTSEIEQTVRISVSDNQFLTIIQTDKPKYKPGETIRMRIFFIHRDGTAVNETEIRNFYVEIRNNHKEVIHAILYKEFEPKVFTYTFELVNEAFEGDYKVHVWTNVKAEDDDVLYDEEEVMQKTSNVINVNVNDSTSQDFAVENYMLPELILNIKTKRIVRPGSSIELNIAAEYSNGIIATGKAVIRASVEQNDELMREYNTTKIIVQKNEIILIETIEHLNLPSPNSKENYNVLISIDFIDDLSQQKDSQTVQVTISDSDTVKLILDPVEDFLRPDSRFTMNVFLKDIDGNFIESTPKPVTMTVKRKYREEVKFEQRNENLTYEDYLPIGSENIDKSVATFVVDVPFNTTSMEFKASYDGVEEKFVVVRNTELPVTNDYVFIQDSKQM